MSLRARILLLVLLATLVPAVLVGAYVFDDRETEIAAAQQSLLALATYADDELDDKVSGTVQLLHGLSHASDLDTGDKAACSAFLGEVLKRYPQYTGLLTIRPDGLLHCDSLHTGRTLDLTDRAYFKQARASADPAFELVFGRLTGAAVLQVAFPARDSAGELKYVLLASLNLAKFISRFAAASHHPEMQVVLWDDKGTVMARQPDDGPKKLAGTAQPGSALYRFMQSNHDATTVELPGPDGTMRIWGLAARPSTAGAGARLTLGIPRDVLLAKANKDLREVLTILAGGSLLAIIFAMLFAELGIRRPVARIMTAANRMSAGDLGARVGAPYPHGEIGALMATLDATAYSVQSQQAQIERNSEQLLRKNRTLRVLSGINTLIVRAANRDVLFKESCRIAVDEGGFRMAWIGVVDRSNMKVSPVASAGSTTDFITLVNQKFSLHEDAPFGNTLSARAIREKRAIFSNDVQNDPAIAFKAEHAQRGSQSMAVLPLQVADEVVGILALYSELTGFFDEEEMKLLGELAGDIGFAVDHIEKKDRLDYLAYYDPLTGLANRGLFLERVAQFVRGAEIGGHKLAIFLIDLERFKNINDSLGRPAGDALLKQAAEWLVQNAGGANLLARVGADHFAAVLPKIKEEGDVARFLEKTITAFMEHPFRLNDAVFRIAAKTGIAVFPKDGDNADMLFTNAEAALKKAKSSGERYLFYRQDMTEKIAGKLTLENQLRQAIDNDEFVLHYQPKFSLASGKITGAEALIRWNDPRSGLVPPGQFIPVLEETGMIYDVGRWALKKAVAKCLHWRAAGLAAVPIAVNVSPLQLRNRGFIDEIRRVVGIDEHAAEGLELEITESLIMEDVKHNIASLQAIRAMGVSIAIDDFGTGFSSLSYLSRLPVHTLKIDRSFVIDMTTGPQGLSLVSTIINLAHSLKLKVVAEGVETEEQSRLLRLLGCDEIQGYLFSKPLPGDIFETKYLAPASVVA